MAKFCKEHIRCAHEVNVFYYDLVVIVFIQVQVLCAVKILHPALTKGGIMLVLLIIYNCSDQVLSTREKRQAKSREAVARSARETAQARERWKSAKDVAKKHASGPQAQLSRTFSQKNSVRQEPLNALGQAKPGTDAALPQELVDASQPKGKEKGEGDLTKMMHELEENPDSHDGFNVEIGDKNIKKQRFKQLQTRSKKKLSRSRTRI